MSFTSGLTFRVRCELQLVLKTSSFLNTFQKIPGILSLRLFYRPPRLHRVCKIQYSISYLGMIMSCSESKLAAGKAITFFPPFPAACSRPFAGTCEMF